MKKRKKIWLIVLAIIAVLAVSICLWGKELLMRTAAGIIRHNIQKYDVGTSESYCEFAVDPEQIEVYTSMGDSTVFGYGLEDMDFDQEPFESTYGYGVCSQYAYPAMIQEQLGLDDEQIHQLAMGRMREEDILFLLDDSFKGDDYTQTYMAQKFWLRHGEGTVEKLKQVYRDSIQDADLITLCMGGNNIFSLLDIQMSREAKGETLLEYAWDRYENSQSVTKPISRIFKIAKLVLSDEAAAYYQKMFEGVFYGYWGMGEYYDDVLDAIHSINPQAKIVLVGMYNPAKDVYYRMNGTSEKAIVDVGAFLDARIFNPINQKFRNYAEENADYCCYIDVSGIDMRTDMEARGIEPNLANGEFLTYFLENNAAHVHPNVEGHQFIYGQITKELLRKK